MSKNVAVFVDVANIFYAAKAAGVDIDYVTLLKAAVAGRDFVRAYAYTGLDPENENQRNFHAFLTRNGYKVVSKDIRKYGDGKVKANLDIELVVDMMKLARNLDVAIVVSGDGDFAPAIRAVQEMGVRVEVISFRGNTSSDLIDVADVFTDIVHLAKVDKSSTRSGRRVTADEEDLSMTEVPEKQTEGTGRGRGGRGGRGRGGRAVERAPERGGERLEPVAAGGRQRNGASASGSAGVAAFPGGSMTVLPGEKLSKLAATAAARPADEEEAEAVETAEVTEAVEAGTEQAEGALAAAGGAVEGGEGEEGEQRRRRRRRGGRGRGRGRGREEGEYVAGPSIEEEEVPLPPRGPRPTPFGSVWDSQIGLTRPPVPAANLTPLPIDEEDLEEPEIPEYLLAEQRRRGRGQGQGQGGRGGRSARSAYAAAIDRERYGRGGGGGINRYPDVSGRGRPERMERQERQDRGRPEPRREERPSGGQGQRERRSAEPWSEVPPELEQMLRAQLANRPRVESRPGPQERAEAERPEAAAAATSEARSSAARGTTGRRRGGRAGAGVAQGAPTEAAVASAGPVAETETEAAAVEPFAEVSKPPAGRRGRTTRAAAGAPAVEAAGGAPRSAQPGAGREEGTAASPARTTRRRGAARGAAPEATPVAGESLAGPSAEAPAPAAAPTRRRTTRAATAASPEAGPAGVPESAEAGTARPRGTRTRRTAAQPAGEAASGDVTTPEPETPKRRTTRRRTTAEPSE